jgi:hypothetical protein
MSGFMNKFCAVHGHLKVDMPCYLLKNTISHFELNQMENLSFWNEKQQSEKWKFI